MLATAYQQISQLPHTSSFYREACKDLWVNLCLAEMSEEQSVPMIHNAYFGQGLRLSNPTQLSSIAEMKNAARALIVDIDSLTEEGQRIAEEIMSNKEDEARLVE